MSDYSYVPRATTPRPLASLPPAGGAGDPPPPPRRSDEPDALVDLHLARRQAAFFLRAVRRRWRVVATTVGSTLGLAVLTLLVVPRSYHVETKILAQRNVVLPMLGNPKRALPADADTPTKLASEAVMSHDNLEAIIAQTNLVANWQATRAPLLRVKDWFHARLFGPLSRRDQVDALIGMLEHRMWVTPGEGTVSIGVLWPNAMQAHQIVLTAQQNFLEERHTAEISTIEESIAILESHSTRVHEEIKSILDDMGTVRRATISELPRSTLPGSAPRATDPRVVELQSELASVQRNIADLDQFRSRRLAELQSTLATQRATYGPSHPVLEGTEQAIRALATDSPQLVQLRQQERTLLADLRARGAALVATPAATGSGMDPVLARAALANMQRAQADSLMEERQTYGRSRLKIAVDAYEDLLGRLEAARIELETTRAAFKYRYGIIVPPEVPKRATSPRPMLLLGGGLVLGLAIGVFMVVASELAGGRLSERWQVERALDLPILGEASLS